MVALNIAAGTVLQRDPAGLGGAALYVVEQFDAREGRAVCTAFYPGLARGNRAVTIVVGVEPYPWSAFAVVGALRWRF